MKCIGKNSAMAKWALSIGLVLAVSGCDLSQHCDPGQIYMDHSCFDVREAGVDGNGGGDGGASDRGAESGTIACQAYEGFGETCTDLSACRCGLDSCNTFMSANYCTHTKCLGNPAVCPPGWTCMDLTAFQPAVGSICLRP